MFSISAGRVKIQVEDHVVLWQLLDSVAIVCVSKQLELTCKQVGVAVGTLIRINST